MNNTSNCWEKISLVDKGRCADLLTEETYLTGCFKIRESFLFFPVYAAITKLFSVVGMTILKLNYFIYKLHKI